MRSAFIHIHWLKNHKFFFSFYILIFCFSTNIMAQVLDYYPEQKKGVSDNDYKYGIAILKETYNLVKKDKGVFNYADYWNLAVSLSKLKDNVDLVRKYLFKSKELDKRNFSVIFLELQSDDGSLKDYLSSSEIESLKNESLEMINSNALVEKTEQDNLINENYNKSLIDLIKKISEDDDKFRFVGNKDMKEQRKLDNLNIKLIDSLYAKYQTYIGKTLVSEELRYVMWSVIQHSNLYSMEKYLPIIFQAVKEGELDLIPLKMLIDRIYTIKYNYQIFGSQSGVDLAPNKIIQEVKIKYNIKNNHNKLGSHISLPQKKNSNAIKKSSKSYF